jgi:hypothetical protein
VRAKAIVVALMLLAVAHSLSLTELWSSTTGGKVKALASSGDGKLGVASAWPDSCAYIFDQSGNLLNKVHGSNWMRDASFSNGIFGFVNYDNYTYLFKGSTFWKKVYVGGDYDYAITVLPNGFIACSERCAYFDFDGNKRWDVDVGRVENGPVVHKGCVYVANWAWKKLLILNLSDGSTVNEISYGEGAWDTAVCGNYLAVGTWRHLYLYDISDPANPRELWRVGEFARAWNVAFSPGCRYIAVSDVGHFKLKIFDVNGKLVFERGYETYVDSVAWWMDRIAVGVGREVHVYQFIKK